MVLSCCTYWVFVRPQFHSESERKMLKTSDKVSITIATRPSDFEFEKWYEVIRTVAVAQPLSLLRCIPDSSVCGIRCRLYSRSCGCFVISDLPGPANQLGSVVEGHSTVAQTNKEKILTFLPRDGTGYMASWFVCTCETFEGWASCLKWQELKWQECDIFFPTNRTGESTNNYDSHRH